MTDAARILVIAATLAIASCANSPTANGLAGLVADGARLERVATGFSFTEGPAAHRDGRVFFTDQPNDRIHVWQPDGAVDVWLEPAGRSNGLYVDNEGQLLACADGPGELWKISADKQAEVLVGRQDGRRLNGPNDLWAAPDGSIYFTDPYYQRPYWTHSAPEMSGQHIYRLAIDGTLSVVDNDLVKPNGIVGSADGRTIYVADIGDDKTYAYTRNDDGSLTDRRLFVPMGSDGMTTDERGNLYLTGGGVSIFDADGEWVGHIPIDEAWTANVTFGGVDHDVLFITAFTSVYTLKMQVRGSRW